MGIRKLLGSALGRGMGSGEPSVIGRIEQSRSGNSILEIGKWLTAGGWTKTEHVALNPDEREALIEELAAHRPGHPGVQFIKVGDTIGTLGAHVLAAQYVHGDDSQRVLGTILAYQAHKQEYVVLTAGSDGSVENGTYTTDEQRALDAYVTRVNDHLFKFSGAKPPTLTYAAVAGQGSKESK